MDTFFDNVRVLNPYGEVLLTDGTGNGDNKGNYWFEAFEYPNFPISGKQYIIRAINRETTLPISLTLTCIAGNTTSSFKKK